MLEAIHRNSSAPVNTQALTLVDYTVLSSLVAFRTDAKEAVETYKGEHRSGMTFTGIISGQEHATSTTPAKQAQHPQFQSAEDFIHHFRIWVVVAPLRAP